MTKVLKVVATVAAVASVVATAGASAGLIAAGGSLFGLGLSATALTAISIGASVGSSLLAGGKGGAAVSNSTPDRLRATIDPRTPRKGTFGKTALATDILDEEFTDDQTYFHRFIVCASHKVESIDEIWFDDELAWSATGGVTSKFTGYLTVTPRTEGTAANAINISARMGTTRRYTGLAYVHLRYRLTGIDKKVESPFAQGITTRITIRGKGAALYDPRMDSTVAGGSGSQRPTNQSTWVWDDDACRNPALALLFYLLGWRINGELAIGKGIPANRIDLASFAVAANICDEEVVKLGGGTEPRYRCDGIFSEADDPEAVIDMLKATMNADLDDVDGKLRLTVFHNDLATPDADFTDDDILDAFDWNPGVELDQSFNIVRGLYVDPSDESLYQMVDYPQVEIASPDGIDRIETVNFGLVQNASQAQRLAQLRLQRQRYGGVFSAEFQATAWKVQKNSIVRLTFKPRGWANKLFRVAEMEIREDGVVPLVLREEHADIYGPPSLSAPVNPTASTPWDPTLDPINAFLATLQEGATANTPRGPFSLTETYNPGDIVLWDVADGGDGSAYARIGTGTTTGVLPSNTTYWVKLVQRGADGAPGGGAAAIEASLQPSALVAKSYVNGGVTDWTGLGATVRIVQSTTNIAGSFTLSVADNPQNLTVSISGMDVSITGAGTAAGEFANEAVDRATLTIRATGSGSFAGVTRDMVLSLAKARGGYEILSALPSTNLFEGRMVYRTSDDKLYRYTGSAWTSATDATDIVGQLAEAQIGDNAITAGKIGARAVVASKLAVTDFENLAVNGSLQTGTLDGWSRVNFNAGAGSSISVGTDAVNWPSQHGLFFYRAPGDGAELSVVNGNGSWDTAGYNDGIQLDPGEELYVEATMWCQTAGVLFGFDVLGKGIGGGLTAIACEALANCYVGGGTQVWYNGGPTFTNVSFAALNTTGARQRVFVRVNGPATGGNQGYLWNLKIRRRNNAKLIVDGEVITQKLSAGAVTAAKMAVTQLDAITANVGLLRTASSGARMEIESNQVRAYDSAGTLRVRLGVW